ncbi:MAG: 3-methyl-2-oxobutanoate hydroxymethyltransferase [Chlamydiae bacterium]|nr:MAG: 3-methyl-2-oxobutanoate hydroxymethyltransferase [Chlamydiota bacterium]
MKKRTLFLLQKKKEKNEKIISLTAYDALTAAWLSECDIDFLLVGDSLGNVVAGYESTLPVTMDQMAYHTEIVVRGAVNVPVVADMPFLSYEINPEEAVRNAGRLVKQSGAAGVKIEGGMNIIHAVKKITAAHIPVLGHTGLKPQTILQLGKYNVQGKTPDSAEIIKEEARALQEAGVFAVVLECIPGKLAQEITEELTIPTIGIGAGKNCDGQILVTHDLLGWYEKPKHFVKQYSNFRNTAITSVQKFINEVNTGEFPDKNHSF